MPNKLRGGGCDHAVSATTCQTHLILAIGVPGAAPDQSRSASGVYTGLGVKQKMWGVGYLAPPSFIRSLRSVMNCGRHSWLLTLMVSIPIADTVNSELLEFIYVDSVLLDDRVQIFC